MNVQEASYCKGVGIADVLLSRGIPVIKVSTADMGAAVLLTFQLRNAPGRYVAIVPAADATVERFTELYEAVA